MELVTGQGAAGFHSVEDSKQAHTAESARQVPQRPEAELLPGQPGRCVRTRDSKVVERPNDPGRCLDDGPEWPAAGDRGEDGDEQAGVALASAWELGNGDERRLLLSRFQALAPTLSVSRLQFLVFHLAQRMTMAQPASADPAAPLRHAILCAAQHASSAQASAMAFEYLQARAATPAAMAAELETFLAELLDPLASLSWAGTVGVVRGLVEAVGDESLAATTLPVIAKLCGTCKPLSDVVQGLTLAVAALAMGCEPGFSEPLPRERLDEAAGWVRTSCLLNLPEDAQNDVSLGIWRALHRRPQRDGLPLPPESLAALSTGGSAGADGKNASWPDGDAGLDTAARPVDELSGPQPSSAALQLAAPGMRCDPHDGLPTPRAFSWDDVLAGVFAAAPAGEPEARQALLQSLAAWWQDALEVAGKPVGEQLSEFMDAIEPRAAELSPGLMAEVVCAVQSVLDDRELALPAGDRPLLRPLHWHYGPGRLPAGPEMILALILDDEQVNEAALDRLLHHFTGVESEWSDPSDLCAKLDVVARALELTTPDTVDAGQAQRLPWLERIAVRALDRVLAPVQAGRPAGAGHAASPGPGTHLADQEAAFTLAWLWTRAKHSSEGARVRSQLLARLEGALPAMSEQRKEAIFGQLRLLVSDPSIPRASTKLRRVLERVTITRWKTTTRDPWTVLGAGTPSRARSASLDLRTPQDLASRRSELTWEQRPPSPPARHTPPPAVLRMAGDGKRSLPGTPSGALDTEPFAPEDFDHTAVGGSLSREDSPVIRPPWPLSPLPAFERKGRPAADPAPSRNEPAAGRDTAAASARLAAWLRDSLRYADPQQLSAPLKTMMQAAGLGDASLPSVLDQIRQASGQCSEAQVREALLTLLQVLGNAGGVSVTACRLIAHSLARERWQHQPTAWSCLMTELHRQDDGMQIVAALLHEILGDTSTLREEDKASAVSLLALHLKSGAHKRLALQAIERATLPPELAEAMREDIGAVVLHPKPRSKTVRVPSRPAGRPRPLQPPPTHVSSASSTSRSSKTNS